MSTRAYRIIEIKTEDGSSLNLSHQDALANYLGTHDEDGIYRIDKNELGLFLSDKTLHKEYDVDDYQLKQLQADYDNTDDEYIEYLTY